VDNLKPNPHPSAVSVGRKLKDAREKKSLTIEQVQKQSRIHSSVLKALEDGHASVLLTDTYVRSFLKKYCQILGLSASEILKEYFPARQDLPAQSARIEESPLPHETKVMPKVLYFTGIAVFAIVALIVVVMLGAKLVSSINKARLTHNERRIEAASATASKKRQSKTAKPAAKKKVQPKTETASKDIVPKSEKLNLTIKMKESIMVGLKRDGVMIYTVIMNKDTVKKVTANDSIELDVIKTDALELTLNGQQIALPPNKRIVGIIITRKGVRLK
jgi:cytoskeletal protein RodZ